MAEKSGQRGHGAAHVGQAPVDGGHGALQARQAREQRREEVVEGARGASGPVQEAQRLLVEAQLCLLHLLLATPLRAAVLEPHLQQSGRSAVRTRDNTGGGWLQ